MPLDIPSEMTIKGRPVAGGDVNGDELLGFDRGYINPVPGFKSTSGMDDEKDTLARTNSGDAQDHLEVGKMSASSTSGNMPQPIPELVVQVRSMTLVRRAFYDSTRVWSGGSLLSNVLLTSTATASIAGAAIVPVVTAPANPYDLFLVDSPSGAYYRLDLETFTGVRLGASPTGLPTLGLGATSAPVTLANGTKLPRGSLIAVIEINTGDQQAIVAFRPGSAQPVLLARIDPSLPGATFTFGDGLLYALQADGTLWKVDPRTGSATRISQSGIPPGPIAYDATMKTIFVLGNGVLTRLNPATGEARNSMVLPAVAEFQACGLARTAKDRLFIAEAETGRIFLLNTTDRTVKALPLRGVTPAQACVMAVALRK